MENQTVEIKLDDKNSIKIHRFGATVTSWVCDDQEQLFLSSISKMDGSKAIRGGVPIVFPNFGPWADGRPQHGFARISWWNVVKDTQQTSSSDATVTLQLTDDETTRAIWNYKFELTLKVTLKPQCLSMELSVKNTDDKPFDFTALLHTYVKVPDITTTSVDGFQGSLYYNKVEKTSDNVEARNKILIDCNVDNIYRNAGDMTGHTVYAPEKIFKVEKINLPDTVLWNPWVEMAAAMSDFDDQGYKEMICVEAGFVSERKILQANEVFVGAQTLSKI